MSTNLETFENSLWEAQFTSEEQNRAAQALENGKVLYLPSLAFPLQLEEKAFLSASILDPKSKNISYNAPQDELKGSSFEGSQGQQLKNMIQRYSLSSVQLLKQLLPFYTSNLILGKTSFRPVEVEGRKTSFRKDDTLLHVDSFPSNPTQGQRILRVFTNVNPEGKPRVWRIGESLENVFHRFLPRANSPIWGVPTLLKTLGITKDYRTAYDHYMLQIHDQMKEDQCYQQNVTYEEVLFPPGASWIVFTDQVSHAAMSGQHLFEQTFYLPVHGQKSPQTSPLKLLEKLLNQKLVG
jgi:hypothetical protein